MAFSYVRKNHCITQSCQEILNRQTHTKDWTMWRQLISIYLYCWITQVFSLFWQFPPLALFQWSIFLCVAKCKQQLGTMWNMTASLWNYSISIQLYLYSAKSQQSNHLVTAGREKETIMLLFQSMLLDKLVMKEKLKTHCYFQTVSLKHFNIV